jgi:hypothetical protein
VGKSSRSNFFYSDFSGELQPLSLYTIIQEKRMDGAAAKGRKRPFWRFFSFGWGFLLGAHAFPFQRAWLPVIVGNATEAPVMLKRLRFQRLQLVLRKA